MNCRFCGKKIEHLFVSLGKMPLANAFLTAETRANKDKVYPLDAYVCDGCFLVQLPEFEKPENIFSDYAYFSSYSETWLEHSKAYVDKMIGLFGIGRDSYVVEIASNDGYLLQYFAERKIPVLGIEPARNVAEAAIKKGIPTEMVFFGVETAKRLSIENRRADLILGNNVLAHVPDLNDFVKGLKILLKPAGVITMEFPHFMRLMEDVQFDTIYHEHLSYFLFLTAARVFLAHGLEIFDVETLPTHGGSLRVYAKHEGDTTRPVSRSVYELKNKEEAAGYTDIKHYLSFEEKVKLIRAEILKFLKEAKKANKRVIAYGAAAKGNTLLNYCGIKADLIDYAADKNPYKQGRFLPGSRIPVYAPDKIRQTKADYVFILPWNIKEEIMEQLSYIRGWGGKFVVPVPKLMVI